MGLSIECAAKIFCTYRVDLTTVLVMSGTCALILDELLGAPVLSLSDVASPTCAPVVPALLSLLSSDLVLSSLLLLSLFLSQLLGLLFFGGVL